jgi:hypothetical protein
VKIVFHRLAQCLLVAGLIYYGYGLQSGAGLSGWLMRWQLESKGSLVVGLWEALGFFLLVVVPLIAVTNTQAPRPAARPASRASMALFFSIALALLLFAGWTFWMANSGPDIEATPLRLEANQTLEPNQGMVRLAGLPQNQLAFRYVAVTQTGRGSTSKAQSEWRTLTPIAGREWKPGQPVRFLFASNTYQLGPEELPAGLLLRNPLPWYLRSVLERKGLRLADPYYVVDTNPYLAWKANWDAMCVISGFLGSVLLAVFLFMYWPAKN